MMSMLSRFLGGLLLAAAAFPALAQDDPNRPVLPDIAPRVVEIRGQLEISLPSLQRQPLMGFNPPPRVAPIPPDRRPYVEEYKQESLDLPPSPLSAPEAPSVSSLISGAPRNGLMEGSVGIYFSRALRFRSEFPLSRSVAIYSHLDYEGTDGHEPFDDRPEITASSNALQALVGLQHVGRYRAVGTEVDGFLNAYSAFAALPASNAPHLDDEPPMRDGRGGGISLWLRSQATSYVDFNGRVRYGTTEYETDALAREDPREELFMRDEKSIEGEADIRVPLAPRQFILGDAKFTGVGLDGESATATVRMLDGAGGLHFSYGRRIEIAAQARLMSFAAEDHAPWPTSSQIGAPAIGSGDATYIAPDVLVNVYAAPGVRLYVENDARSEHLTLASLYRQNPFVVDKAVIQPTIYTLDARGGGHLLAGVFEADLFAGYSQAPQFMYFERSTPFEANGFARGFVAPRYDEAIITYFGGDLSVNLPAGFNASVGLTVRDGKLTDNDEEIPYFGPIVGRGAVSYSFDSGRGFIQAISTYESARFVDRAQSRKIGDYFDLDVEMSYTFLRSLAAVVRLDNISADHLERWEDYDQPPFVGMMGVRVVW